MSRGDATLVATFNATTGWAGKQITYGRGWYRLEGHGTLTPEAVYGYYRAGQVDWASDAARAKLERILFPPATMEYVWLLALSPLFLLLFILPGYIAGGIVTMFAVILDKERLEKRGVDTTGLIPGGWIWWPLWFIGVPIYLRLRLERTGDSLWPFEVFLLCILIPLLGVFLIWVLSALLG